MTAPFIAQLGNIPKAAADATAAPNPFLPGFELDPTPYEVAAHQLDTNGITDYQRSKAYKQYLSESLYRYVTPMSYHGHGLQVLKALASAATMHKPDPNTDLNNQSWDRVTPDSREDAWRIYLGLPQRHGTFEVSPYRPSRSFNQKNYFRLKNWKGIQDLQDSDFAPYYIKNIVTQIDTNKGKAQRNDPDVMGNYTLQKGKDDKGNYVAYYDKWDLDAPGAGLVGHPYEIYDRLYYDPKTFKPLKLKPK